MSNACVRAFSAVSSQRQIQASRNSSIAISNFGAALVHGTKPETELAENGQNSKIFIGTLGVIDLVRGDVAPGLFLSGSCERYMQPLSAGC